MNKFLYKHILYSFLILILTQGCNPYQYSPHPIHTRITSDHYRKLEETMRKREEKKLQAAQQMDNDNNYYLRQHNYNADNQPYYPNYAQPPIIIQQPQRRPQNVTRPIRPTQNPMRNNAPQMQSAPPPADNDNSYYLRGQQTNQDNPARVPQYNNNTPTIIVIPTPQVTAPSSTRQPAPYPADNDSDYFMDYNTKPITRPRDNRPNNQPNTINDLDLFFNDS